METTTYTITVGKKWYEDYCDRNSQYNFQTQTRQMIIGQNDDRTPVFATTWQVVKEGQRTVTVTLGAQEIIEYLNDAIYTSEDLMLDTDDADEKALARAGKATAKAIIKQIGAETLANICEYKPFATTILNYR
jgi:hypothetical protein